MSTQNPRFHFFVALSALLTGVDEVRLLGTGQAEVYLATLEAILPATIIDELLGCFMALPTRGREAAAESEILADARLGPIARNIILMWYRGVWVQLPVVWRANFGTLPGDENRLISGTAYQAGLQWDIAGAHPMGARQQGYASWALMPTMELYE